MNSLFLLFSIAIISICHNNLCYGQTSFPTSSPIFHDDAFDDYYDDDFYACDYPKQYDGQGANLTCSDCISYKNCAYCSVSDGDTVFMPKTANSFANLSTTAACININSICSSSSSLGTTVYISGFCDLDLSSLKYLIILLYICLAICAIGISSIFILPFFGIAICCMNKKKSSVVKVPPNNYASQNPMAQAQVYGQQQGQYQNQYVPQIGQMQQGQPQYILQGQPQYMQQGQPQYIQQGQPQYMQQGQPQYMQQGQPQYMQQGQPQYMQQGQPQYMGQPQQAQVLQPGAFNEEPTIYPSKF